MDISPRTAVPAPAMKALIVLLAFVLSACTAMPPSPDWARDLAYYAAERC